MRQQKLKLPTPFEEIMGQYEQEIMRYLLRVSGDREDAADLFQETWLRAYRAYPRLEPGSAVRPWLYAIAVNLRRNRARDGARRGAVIVADGSPNARIGKSHRSASENDGYAAVRLRELMFALPAKQREALQLRYFAGLGYAEIATALHCTQEGARANVSHALRTLKSTW